VKRKSRMPELLAPAGSWGALEAALDSGADAVYLAGKRFGARRGAENFDDSELARAIDIAHLSSVRVYVAVNTLIPEAELEEVAAHLLSLYEAGADAVLVQDLGVVSLARDLVPELELHASTQMTITSIEGARWAADMGLSRAVLARELSLSEVEEIARASPIELEVFVHGALCYSYSGQCLLSSVIGGRSGNRGSCAQPCRKPYRLLRSRRRDAFGRPLQLEEIPTEGRYLLSMRDLSVYPHIEDLARASIAALKIEGRMRSPEYVRTVVSIYRRALDGISEGGWSPSEEDERDLALAFNRTFTPGCIGGAPRGDLVSAERPDHRGLRIGEVVSWDRRSGASVRVEGSVLPEVGDGLVIISGGREVGLVVRSLKSSRGGTFILAVGEPVDGGAEVFLTRRASLGRRPGPRSRREISIDLSVRWEGRRPVLEGKAHLPDGKVFATHLEADFAMEPARERPLSAEEIEAQLRKTGGTPFAMGTVEMDYPGGLFAPLGEINRLRREFLELAEREVIATFRPAEGAAVMAEGRLSRFLGGRRAAPRRPSSSKNGLSISVYADTLAAVAGAAEGGCRRIYFEPPVGIGPRRRCSPIDTGPAEVLEILGQAGEVTSDAGADLAWKWPRITRQRFLDSALFLLKEVEVAEVMVEGVGLPRAVKGARPDMRVSASVGLNVWNSLSVELLAPELSRLTLSPELSAREVEDLSAVAASILDPPDLEVLVQGNVEAMVAENCLLSSAPGCEEVAASGDAFWGIEDETGRVFPVRADGEGRTHVQNAVELSLLDQLPKLAGLGVSSIAIDARGRTAEYARRIVEIYDQGLKGGDLDRLRREAREISLGGTTGGAFLRGRRE